MKFIIPFICIVQAWFGGIYYSEEVKWADGWMHFKKGMVMIFIMTFGVLIVPAGILVGIWGSLVKLDRAFSFSFIVRHLIFKQPIKDFTLSVFNERKEKIYATNPKWYQFSKRNLKYWMRWIENTYIPNHPELK